MHAWSDEVVLRGCLLESGAATVTIEALRKYEANADIAKELVAATANFTNTGPGERSAVAAGAVPLLLGIARVHMNIAVVRSAVAALRNCRDDGLAALLREPVTPALFDLLRRFPDDAEVAASANHIFASLLRTPEGYDAIFADPEVVTLMITTTYRTHTSDAEVVLPTCMAVTALCMHGGAAVCARFVDSGCVSLCMRALSLHESDSQVRGFACGVLAELIRCRAGLARLSDPLVIRQLLPMVHKHKADADFLRAAFGVLRTVAGAPSAIPMLTEAGAVPILVAGMKAHPRNANLCERAVVTLARLAEGYMPCIPQITATAPAAPLLSILRNFAGGERTVTAACSVLCLMVAVAPDTCDTLVLLGAVPLVLTSMRRHPSNSALAQHGAAFIMRLAMVCAVDDPKVVTEDAVAAVIEAMTRHLDDVTVSMVGCEAVCALLRHERRGVDPLVARGAAAAVQNVFARHMNDEDVFESAVKAVFNMLAVDARSSRRLSKFVDPEMAGSLASLLSIALGVPRARPLSADICRQMTDLLALVERIKATAASGKVKAGAGKAGAESGPPGK